MNRFLLIAGLVLAATTAGAESIPMPRERPLPGKDITCRGPFSMYGGAGGYDPDVRMIGEPETRLCYLRGNPEASAIVDAACKMESPAWPVPGSSAAIRPTACRKRTTS
jgi:hypothetical protein